MTCDQTGGMVNVFDRWFGSWQISVKRRGYAPRELRQVYDAEASSWDTTVERLGFPDAYRQLFRSMGQEVTHHQAVSDPVTVLDCGVGTGALSAALASEWHQPVQMSGVDISPGMLACAAKNFRKLGKTSDLRTADLQALPYPAAHFDLVMGAHVIEHLPDPEAAVREMARVLKPGGWLLIILTRPSGPGRYIHLKWRTHLLPRADVTAWLDRSGMTGFADLPLGGNSMTRFWSTALLARKRPIASQDTQNNLPAPLPRMA